MRVRLIVVVVVVVVTVTSSYKVVLMVCSIVPLK